MKIKLLLGLVALIIGFFLIELIKDDAGYVLISIGHYTFEATFWVAVFVLIVLYGLWWIFASLVKSGWGSVKHGFSWYAVRQSRSADALLHQAIELLIEENYHLAEKNLILAAKKQKQSPHLLLTASFCDYQQKEYQKALYLIEKSESLSQGYHPVYFLLRAKIYFAMDDLQAALSWLQQLSDSSRLHPLRITLLKKIFSRNQNIEALCGLLPDIRATDALAPATKQHFELQIWQQKWHTLSTKIQDNERQAVIEVIQKDWKKMPKKLSHHPEIVASYVDSLLRLNAKALALTTLLQLMPKVWSDKLVSLFAELDTEEHQKALKTAQAWLEKQGPSQALLTTLATLADRCELTALAESYLIKADQADPSYTTKTTLARFYVTHKQPDKALELYQQADSAE